MHIEEWVVDSTPICLIIGQILQDVTSSSRSLYRFIVPRSDSKKTHLTSILFGIDISVMTILLLWLVEPANVFFT